MTCWKIASGRLLIEIFRFNRLAIDPKLQDFNLLLTVKDLVGEKYLKEQAESAKPHPEHQRQHHYYTGAYERSDHNAGDAWVGQGLPGFIPGNLALIVNLIEQRVRNLTRGRADHHRHQRT